MIPVVLPQTAESPEDFFGGLGRRLGEPVLRVRNQGEPIHENGGVVQPLLAPIRDLVRFEPGDGLQLAFDLPPLFLFLDFVKPRTAGQQRQEYRRQGGFHPTGKQILLRFHVPLPDNLGFGPSDQRRRASL